jgi:protease stability complex PrcB-like protein
MIPRSHYYLRYLALLSITACGSGRLVPAEAPEPAAPGPVAEPGPAAEPEQAAPPPSGAPSPDVAAPYAPYGASGSLPIRRIGQWTASGLSTSQRQVIQDDSTYAQFWQALAAGERPAVDFSRDVVIAVASGQRPSGGHAIAVERVARAGPGMVVEVVEIVPGPGCWTTQQITQPVDVVVVAAADAQTWSFKDNTRTQPCQ